MVKWSNGQMVELSNLYEKSALLRIRFIRVPFFKKTNNKRRYLLLYNIKIDWLFIY